MLHTRRLRIGSKKEKIMGRSKLFNFSQFITESSTAGSKHYTGINFKFARKDIRDGYFIDDLIRDIHSYGDNKGQVRNSITQVIDEYTKNKGVASIRELDQNSLNNFIARIEEIIEKGGEPDIMEMPSGSFLFIRDHVTPDGKTCDFYMNGKRTKIEIVSIDSSDDEESHIIPVENFNPEDFGISGKNLERFNFLKEGL